MRGLCRWVRFASDSSRADAEAAYADFSDAAEAIEAAPGRFTTPLDRIYSQRAFVALGLRPGDWDAVVADLTRAVEASPDEPTPVLDRGIAHREAGDTAAARRDFERFLTMAPADSARGDLVRQMLAEVRSGG